MIHSKNEARDGLKAVVSREIPPKSFYRFRLSACPGVAVLCRNLVHLRAKRNFSTTANSPGFTLIEVLLTVALVAIVLGPIYILQHTIFNNTVRSTDAVDRMFIAYTFLLEAQKQKAAGAQQKKLTKLVADPKTELIYEIKELGADAQLAKQFNHLYVEKVSYNWSTLGLPYADEYNLIVFEPPQEEQKTENKEKKAPEPLKPIVPKGSPSNSKPPMGGAKK